MNDPKELEEYEIQVLQCTQVLEPMLCQFNYYHWSVPQVPYECFISHFNEWIFLLRES